MSKQFLTSCKNLSGKELKIDLNSENVIVSERYVSLIEPDVPEVKYLCVLV